MKTIIYQQYKHIPQQVLSKFASFQKCDNFKQLLAANRGDVVVLSQFNSPKVSGQKIIDDMLQIKKAQNMPTIIILKQGDRQISHAAKSLHKAGLKYACVSYRQCSGYDSAQILKLANVTLPQVKTASTQTKEAQSLMQSFYQSLTQFGFPKNLDIGDSASSILFDIWKNESNRINNKTFIKPISVKGSQIDAMQRQGLVSANFDKITITAKGSQVIKTMVLGDLSSTFDTPLSQKQTYRKALSNTKNIKKAKRLK